MDLQRFNNGAELDHAMIGAHSLDADVIPFAIAAGNRAKLSGINVIGLERRGFSLNSSLVFAICSVI